MCMCVYIATVVLHVRQLHVELTIHTLYVCIHVHVFALGVIIVADMSETSIQHMQSVQNLHSLALHGTDFVDVIVIVAILMHVC